MTKIYAIYGAGGHGREVLPILRDKLNAEQIDEAEICFIVDNKNDSIINDTFVYSFEEFCQLEIEEKYFTVSIADSEVRNYLFNKCEMNNLTPFSLISNNSIIMDYNTIGEGLILSPFTCITSNIKIGKAFHANIYSHVSHDCIIGDYVTFGPGVRCNGNVVIEDNVYIGSGAIIKQGTKNNPRIIGRNAVVGMGAVVVADVLTGTTVVGNPAKILQRKI